MKYLTILTLSVAALFASPVVVSAAPMADATAAHAVKGVHAARHGKHQKRGKHGKRGKRKAMKQAMKRALVQRFDRNGDRRLDPTERAAVKAQFDTNRDGKLDRVERKAMRQAILPNAPVAAPGVNRPAR